MSYRCLECGSDLIFLYKDSHERIDAWDCVVSDGDFSLYECPKCGSTYIDSELKKDGQ